MMRKLFTTTLALALLALARLASADGPVMVAPVVVGCQGGCSSDCVQKVCKPIVQTKTVIKPAFTSVCEDYCEPRCWSCGLFGGCSECGPSHSCGNVKTRKILVVKLVKEEKCVNKCVVDYVPACETAAPCCSSAPCGTPAPCCTSSTVIAQPASAAPVMTPLRMPATMPIAH